MSNPLETRFLLAAVILAEELSFTEAAKRLKMSQSGVSRRLNELEERCGFKLFNRDHATVVITDAGRAFVEEAKLSIFHDERAIESGKSANAGIESHLTIGPVAVPRSNDNFNVILDPTSSLSQPRPTNAE